MPSTLSNFSLTHIQKPFTVAEFFTNPIFHSCNFGSLIYVSGVLSSGWCPRHPVWVTCSFTCSPDWSVGTGLGSSPDFTKIMATLLLWVWLGGRASACHLRGHVLDPRHHRNVREGDLCKIIYRKNLEHLVQISYSEKSGDDDDGHHCLRPPPA